MVMDGLNTLLLITFFSPMGIFNLAASSLPSLGGVYSVAEIVMWVRYARPGRGRADQRHAERGHCQS